MKHRTGVEELEERIADDDKRNKPRVLYAKEYRLPLLEEIYEEYNIKIINTADETLDFLRSSESENIDAYVLGMMMVKDGEDIKKVDKIHFERENLLIGLDKVNPSRNLEVYTEKELEGYYKSQELFKREYACLDYQAGLRVLEELITQDTFKEKPILIVGSVPLKDLNISEYITNLEEIEDNQLKDVKTNKIISYLEIPVEDIEDWFAKNVPIGSYK
jgi:hypothetical protein